MSTKYELWFVSVIIPKSQWMIFASTKYMLGGFWRSNVAHRVRVALKETNLFNLHVFKIHFELLNQFIFWTDEENAIISSYARSAESNIWAHIALNSFMFNNVHIISQTNDRCISFKISHQYVLVIVEEVTRKDHSLWLIIHWNWCWSFSHVPICQ